MCCSRKYPHLLQGWFLVWNPLPLWKFQLNFILSFKNLGFSDPPPPYNFQWPSIEWVWTFSGTTQLLRYPLFFIYLLKLMHFGRAWGTPNNGMLHPYESRLFSHKRAWYPYKNVSHPYQCMLHPDRSNDTIVHRTTRKCDTLTRASYKLTRFGKLNSFRPVLPRF